MPRADRDPLAPLLAAIPALTGSPVTEAQREGFRRYLDVFLRWNRVHRMTALSSPLEIVQGLFLDSLLFLPLLPARPMALLDIGAGSGIPGLPLRLVDDRICLTLIEARRKRVSFLRAVCRELRLEDVRVLEGRAEELIDHDPSLPDSFDAVVARAVGAPLMDSVGTRYLRHGGTLVIAGGAQATTRPPLEAVRVEIPGTAATRIFLRAVKQSNVPRGT